MSSRVLPRSPWFHHSFLKPIPSSTTVRYHSSLVSLPWTNFSFPIIHSFLYLRMHNSWYILHRQFLICYQRFMILFHALNSITKYLKIESSKFVSFDFKRFSILMKKWSLFARYPQNILSTDARNWLQLVHLCSNHATTKTSSFLSLDSFSRNFLINDRFCDKIWVLSMLFLSPMPREFPPFFLLLNSLLIIFVSIE